MARKRKNNPIARNRKAWRDYAILERYEAGIELRGTEVKSIRSGYASLDRAYASWEDGELYLYNMHIKPYEYGNVHNHDPVRPRRLLMHRKEIKHLSDLVKQKGFALVPLKVYEKRGYFKIQIGLCKGKSKGDKRETLKRRTAEREANRAISQMRY